MENKSSAKTIFIDALLLCLITIFAALCLGTVYEITKKPIEAARKKAENKALSAVIPGAHNFTAIPKEFSIVDPEDVLRDNGFEKIKVEDTKIVFDENENGIGYVMRIISSIGYSGDIIFLLGYRFDGTVTGIEFLEVSESPGLGLNIKEDFFKNDFKNKKAKSFRYIKNRDKNIPKNDGDVDALSGATISTNAVVKAVNAGICYAESLAAKQIGFSEIQKKSQFTENQRNAEVADFKNKE